jgi:hypothetical protein
VTIRQRIENSFTKPDQFRTAGLSISPLSARPKFLIPR